jgi:hypothetical protein
MVKNSSVILGALLLSVAVAAEDLNYDSFLNELNDGQQKIDYSKGLVKHDQLHILLDQVKDDEAGRSPNGKGGQPTAEAVQANVDTVAPGGGDARAGQPDESGGQEAAEWKGADEAGVEEGYEADGSPGQSEATPASVKTGRQSNGGYFYVAPSLRRGATQVSNDIFLARSEKASAYFGITIGTEISVDLKKSASNVQEGYVALSVRVDVVGQQHSLSRNGTLFARPTAVKGSERLFLRIERGITPEGYEFAANGVVLGEDGKPGLAAKVVSDGKVLERALNAGEDTIAGAVVGVMAPDVAGAAAKSGVNKLLEDKQQGDNDKSGQRAYIVLAEPQRATIQVEATF